MYWVLTFIVVFGIESYRDPRTMNEKFVYIFILSLVGFIIVPFYLFEKPPKELTDAEMKETISDGFGNEWSAYCPTCGQKSMQIVRPGKVQCGNCE